MSWGALKPREKNLLRYLLLLVAVGLLLMALRGLFASTPSPGATAGSPPAAGAAAAGTAAGQGQVAAEEAAMAADLGRVLADVAGAGQVHVRVALASTDERVYVVDRTISQQGGAYAASGGAAASAGPTQRSDKTVTVGGSALPAEVLRPQVVSVLVVSSGAADPVVRAALTRAAAAALDVPLYSVTVVVGKGAGGSDH